MSITASQLATTSMIGQVGGGITSAMGGYFSASGQKASLKAQVAIADTNARIAELGAQSALQQPGHDRQQNEADGQAGERWQAFSPTISRRPAGSR